MNDSKLNLSRRSFVSTTLALGAATAVAPLRAAESAAAKPAFGSTILPPAGKRLLLSCKLSMIAKKAGDKTLTVTERLRMAGDAGFDGVDFDEAGSFTADEAREAVRASGVFVHNAINHTHWGVRLTDAKQETRDKAYIAIRKAEFAAASARTSLAAREKKDAETEGQKFQGDTLKKTQAELANTQNALSKTQDELKREAAARAEAEKRAAQALADLQKIAAVKKDDRGMVITLSGGVLFPTDKSELLAGAMAQLNQVGEALVRNSPDSRITVEGHTDSQGQAAHNQELSQKRAESVATYLRSRGIAPDRVTAVGKGPDKPIADNKTLEGRAQNRRVEIIVEPPK